MIDVGGLVEGVVVVVVGVVVVVVGVVTGVDAAAASHTIFVFELGRCFHWELSVEMLLLLRVIANEL